MKRRFFQHFIIAGMIWLGSMATAHAAPNVTCSNPGTMANMGGGTVNLVVTCTISNVIGLSTLTSLGTNVMTPYAITLRSGTNTITAQLLPYVTSPDGTVTGIAGLPLTGIVGVLTPPTATLQFHYQAITSSSTPAGTYTSTVGAATFNYSILQIPPVYIYSGTANATLSVTVPAPPTTVSCASPPASAPPGGGTFNFNVLCTVGVSGDSFSPGSSNFFSPGTVTLTNERGDSLNANLNSIVTSPDGTVTGISGTASGGFTGTIQSLPASIQAQYTGSTTSRTPSGSYTSAPITFTWSTL